MIGDRFSEKLVPFVERGCESGKGAHSAGGLPVGKKRIAESAGRNPRGRNFPEVGL